MHEVVEAIVTGDRVDGLDRSRLLQIMTGLLGNLSSHVEVEERRVGPYCKIVGGVVLIERLLGGGDGVQVLEVGRNIESSSCLVVVGHVLSVCG